MGSTAPGAYENETCFWGICSPKDFDCRASFFCSQRSSLLVLAVEDDASTGGTEPEGAGAANREFLSWLRAS